MLLWLNERGGMLKGIMNRRDCFSFYFQRLEDNYWCARWGEIFFREKGIEDEMNWDGHYLHLFNFIRLLARVPFLVFRMMLSSSNASRSSHHILNVLHSVISGSWWSTVFLHPKLLSPMNKKYGSALLRISRWTWLQSRYLFHNPLDPIKASFQGLHVGSVTQTYKVMTRAVK